MVLKNQFQKVNLAFMLCRKMNQKKSLNILLTPVSFLRSKKADLALGYMGKMIIALVALLVLLYIIGIITGEFGSQGDKTVDVLSNLG